MAENNLTQRKQKVCSLCYRHAEENDARAVTCFMGAHVISSREVARCNEDKRNQV